MNWLALAAAALGACGGSGGACQHSRGPDETTGCGSDEQWATFDDQEMTATADDSMAPQVTQPSLTATVPFSPKPVFQWNQDPNDPGQPDGDVPYIDGPECMACCPQFNTGALTTLHLPVISGNEYDLQFFKDGCAVHRVITTLQEWTPPDDLWNSWKGATITLKLYRMTVLRNADKAGPFVQTQPIVIHVGS